jgi:hypothetical protein
MLHEDTKICNITLSSLWLGKRFRKALWRLKHILCWIHFSENHAICESITRKKWQSQKDEKNSQQSKYDMAPHRNDLHARQLRQNTNVQYALQSYGWKPRNYALNLIVMICLVPMYLYSSPYISIISFT